MAASSPSLTNNGLGTSGSSSAASMHRTDTPPKTLRGLNKPKCIQCGNVARSRCPFQSCKGCCSKAENPCPIHVLKANASFPEKTSTPTTPASDQKSNEASPAGSSHRVSSLRQLSSNFAQFNNLSVPVRAKKPLTKKDALALNEWRFLKLKEHKNRNIEIENEAFERYICNVSLLEEVFCASSLHEGNPNRDIEENDTAPAMSGLKLRLRTDPKRTENLREKIRRIVDQGLKDLQTPGLNNSTNDPNDPDEFGNEYKRVKSEWSQRFSALSDLTDKLNKARNEEDLKSCIELKSEFDNRPVITSGSETQNAVASIDEPVEEQPSHQSSDTSSWNLIRAIHIDGETLSKIDAHFSSLEEIEDL